MTRLKHQQLELPVMVDINCKSNKSSISEGSQVIDIKSDEYHKQATHSDQLIYKSISDNYFKD
ncbi:hypothetical protein [Methylophilus sp. Leaf408]|jgi:hypothetical protein|uniref:hypothetical protein n=1 Tax=Methylophilus sp. Leaf408 TaxID=2876561 RepID=UPI001E5D108E|nr:hypothetical protein [Methylophilus sp. Leaf408]